MKAWNWYKKTEKQSTHELTWLGYTFIGAILIAVFGGAIKSKDLFALSILIVFFVAFITLSIIKEMLSNSS